MSDDLAFEREWMDDIEIRRLRHELEFAQREEDGNLAWAEREALEAKRWVLDAEYRRGPDGVRGPDGEQSP